MNPGKFFSAVFLVSLFLTPLGGNDFMFALHNTAASGSQERIMVPNENTAVSRDLVDPRETNIDWYPAWTGGGLLNRHEVGDFDGDRRAELLFHYQTKFGKFSNVVIAWDGLRFKSQRASPSDFGEFVAPNERMRVGDFDQDHRDEVLVNWEDSTGWITHIYDYDAASKKFVFKGEWARGISSAGAMNDFEVGDFDGDGYKDDIVVHNCNAGVSCYDYLYMSNGSSFLAPKVGISGFGGIDENARLRVGDFDNDGRDELLVNWKHPTLGWVTHIYGYNQDQDRIVFERGFEPSVDAGEPDGNFEVGDLDGDGYKDDILVHTRVNGDWYNTTYTSNGSTFIKHGPFLSNFGLVGNAARLRVGNFDGDTQQELSVYWHHPNLGWLNHVYKYDSITGNIVFYGDWTPLPLPYTVFMLKADDLGDLGEEHWSRFTNMIAERNVKASIGIVGSTPSISQVQALAASGSFEFWNHGYDHAPCRNYEPPNEPPPADMRGKTEFHGLVYDDCGTPLSERYATPYKYQQAHFSATQQFFTSQLGFDSHTFGAPYNFADETTRLVLSNSPSIRAIFCLDRLAIGEHFDGYYLGDLSDKTVLKIVIEEGWPPYLMGVQDFIRNYYDKKFYKDEKNIELANQPQYLVLQVHPAAWNFPGEGGNETNWSALDEILDFLIDRDTKFMNPYEYDSFLSGQRRVAQ